MGGRAEDKDFGKISHSRKIGNCKMAIFLLSFFFFFAAFPTCSRFPPPVVPLASSSFIKCDKHVHSRGPDSQANLSEQKNVFT